MHRRKPGGTDTRSVRCGEDVENGGKERRATLATRESFRAARTSRNVNCSRAACARGPAATRTPFSRGAAQVRPRHSASEERSSGTGGSRMKRRRTARRERSQTRERPHGQPRKDRHQWLPRAGGRGWVGWQRWGPVWGEDVVVAPDYYGNDTTSVKTLRKPSEMAVRLCEDLPSHSVQK